MKDLYSDPTYAGSDALLAAIDSDRVEELIEAIVAAALYEEANTLVEAACLRLSTHPDETLRGNAILGFGHLARRFGVLDASGIAAVRSALHDPSSYVRGQAHAAADDVQHFLGIDMR